MKKWTDKMIGIITVAVLFGTVAGLAVEDTHIKTDRNAFRSSICTYYNGNYTESDIAASKVRINQQTYMTDAQIQAVLFGRDFTQIPTQTLLQAAPHAVALVIACILWCPLCCCCIWPEKHPTCRKCRKPEKEMYGKCELKWPAYCAVLAYLLVLGGGIIGIIQGPDIVYYFNDVGCKTSALADDLLNGRISPSVDGRFFVGLAPLKDDLTVFKAAYNTIWTQNQNSLAIAGDVVTKQNFFQTLVNGTYSSYSDISYSSAFASNNGTTPITVNSIFKDSFYGPISNTNSLLGNIYAKTNIIFKQINAILDPMKAAWTNLSTSGQATVNSQMATSITAFSSLSTKINQFLGQVGPLFNKSGVFDQAVLGLKAFYGACFALAFLGSLSSIILACCSVVKIRYILYFTCGLLFFLTLISLGSLTVLGLVEPTLSQTCRYMDTQLSSGASTKQMLSKLGVSSVGDLLSNCMTDGTGWAMNDLSPTFNTTFSDQLLITRNAQLFNLLIPDYSTANLSAPIAAATDMVTKIRKAEVLDVNDTLAIDFIVGIQNVLFPIDLTCDTTRVNGDSWVPSFALYSCPGGKASNNPCLNLAVMATCPAGCYQIMQQMESSSGDSSYATTLANRYGGNSSCNYYNFILNLENQWNIPRSAKMATVLTSLTSIGSAISDYDNTFKSSQANITTYATILSTNFVATTDLVTGSFNGLDCRVIGESLLDLRNSICVGLLNSINYNFICLLLLSYGSLLVACCATCAGVRHFKHLQRMQIRQYKGVPVSISEKRLFDQ